jgi:hypothetical protein
MSTPSTTNTQSLVQELVDPWSYVSNSDTSRFDKAEITIKSTAHESRSFVETLIPLIKDRVRRVEFVNLVDEGYSRVTLRRGMLLCDERGAIIMHITNAHIGYEADGPSLSRDILEMLSLPSGVHKQLSDAVKNIPRRVGDNDRSYGIKLMFL